MEIDLTNCDKEPIHINGNIQPFGFLLLINRETHQIEQGSVNVKEYLGINLQNLTGRPLTILFSEEEQQQKLSSLLAKGEAEGPILIRLKEEWFFCFAHHSARKIVLEFERFNTQSAEESIKANALLKSVQANLNELISVEETATCIASAVQAVLDYDRVLVFQFDADRHAKVVAESAKPGIHSFEGHHFPASDIPAPARKLLMRKHIRHIPDVSASPVEVVPYLNPSTGKPADIGKSELRYPSEIHLEYLRNMGVGASLSFSIMVKGQLWGLISCTNQRPKFINYWKRQLGEQLSKALANILVSNQEKRSLREFNQFKKQEQKLLGYLMSNENNVLEELIKNEKELLSLNRAGGAAVIFSKSIACMGVCRDKKAIDELVDWLSRNNTESVFYTRQLSTLVKNSYNYREQASGLLALELSRFNKEYILFFKPEIKEKKTWAGNPEKPVPGKDKRIHPRKSFEKWEEEIKGKSLPWTVNEVEIGRILVKDVVGVRLRNQARSLEELKEEYQMTAEGLEMKNKQLEDFTRIIAHNLRSPLANVQALYAMHRRDPEGNDAGFFLDKIKVASDSMLATIDDLNQILRQRVGEPLGLKRVDIGELIEKELQNLEAVIVEKEAQLNLELSEPEINTNKAYLESIFHNLLSNALKYTSPQRRPLVEIKSWLENGWVCFSVADNGLGIDLEKYGKKVFGIYKTFHPHPNARGVGLYLTKMQVEAMGGEIEVRSQPNVGTTFTLRLPYVRMKRD